MTDPRDEGARELILSIFRLACSDFLGMSYSHDQYAPMRRTRRHTADDAAAFLSGPWAAYLADLVGFSASAAWREALRLRRDIDAPGTAWSKVA